MATDNDIKKDFEDAYRAGEAHWNAYWDEARTDLKFVQGDQYDSKDKSYLKSMDRDISVFNKTHRIRNLITGYEVKNLLALTVEPNEGSDEKTASLFSGLLMHSMLKAGGYAACSAAFEFGPVMTGMNLIEPWVDRREDLLNGDVRYRRLPYNRFVLDPTLQSRDLDEGCGYLITRDYFSTSAAASMLPERSRDIKKLKAGHSDQKFSYFYRLKGRGNEYNLRWDRFYVETFRPWRVLADTKTGAMIPLPQKGDKTIDEIIRMFLGRYESLKMIKGEKRGVDLHIFVEGNLMYKGLDPTGLDEYPFVLEAGYFTPEEEDAKLRMQSVVRVCRDPGVEGNRRRSMILDMLDGIIRQGWKFKQGSVVNPDELYGSGHSVVVMDEKAELSDAEQLNMPQIPPGLFQALEIMDRDHDNVAGVNSEMMGSPENEDIQVAAILAKLRSANGLTTLQSLFEGHRTAKRLLGNKTIRIFQKNYTPVKVARITGEPPTKEFYDKNFGKYDSAVSEGVLTDTQRQQHYAQMLGYKSAGAPIPWEHVIDFAPIEHKDKLVEAIRKAEQMESAAAQDQKQLDQLTKMILQAEKAHTLASAKEKLSQAEENKSDAQVNRVKAIKEAQQIDLDSFQKTIDLLQSMAMMLRGEQPKQPLPTVSDPTNINV